MFGWIKKVWRWLLRIEGAYAILSFIAATIPVGIAVILTALAQQYAWVVWMVLLASYAFVYMAMYYSVKYKQESSLFGCVSVVCNGMQKTLSYPNKPNLADIRLGFSIVNNSNSAIAISLKSKVTIGGKVSEDDDFDTPILIGAKQSRMCLSDPIKAVDADENEWKSTLEVKFGKSTDRLKIHQVSKLVSSGTEAFRFISFDEVYIT